MKFTWINIFFTLFLTVKSPSSGAKAPILIAHDGQAEKAKIAMKILTKKWHFPSVLIELKDSSTACKKDDSRVIHLCFQSSGKMILAKYDRETVDESFTIFFQKK